MTLQTNFSDFYTAKKSAHLYPTEFVIRAFLGNYPNLTLDKSRYKNANALDLGYGDGRNMPLLHNLGLRLHGVEIDERINELTAARLKEMGIPACLRSGSNNHIPFEDAYFDYVLACHACYYVAEGTSFQDNLHEMARVMKKGGLLICSLPMADTYILKDAQAQGAGLWKITHDPFGLRAGALLQAFESEEGVARSFAPRFKTLQIGWSDDFYWGIRQKLWLVVCRRR